MLRLRLRPAHRPGVSGPGGRQSGTTSVAPTSNPTVWPCARCMFDLGFHGPSSAEHRVIFSQHAMAGDRSQQGELRHHGQVMAPQVGHAAGGPFWCGTRRTCSKPARRSLRWPSLIRPDQSCRQAVLIGPFTWRRTVWHWAVEAVQAQLWVARLILNGQRPRLTIILDK